MSKFQFIDDTTIAKNAAMNMAVDEVLLQENKEDHLLLRIYRWNQPSVTFGYFGKWEELVKAYATVAQEEALMRRWTGGGIVTHGDGIDFTYTLIIPKSHPLANEKASSSYQRIHQAILHALQVVYPYAFQTAKLVETVSTKVIAGSSLVSTADSSIDSPPSSPAQTSCFENPVDFDISINNQKIAGAAQRRTKFGLLHQGSIQFHPVFQWNEQTYLQFAAQLGQSLFNISFTSAHSLKRVLTNKEQQLANQIAQKKYATPEWKMRF